MADTRIMDERARYRVLRYNRLGKTSRPFQLYVSAFLKILVETSNDLFHKRDRWAWDEIEGLLDEADRKAVRDFHNHHGPTSRVQMWTARGTEDEFTLSEGFGMWLLPFWAVLRGGEMTVTRRMILRNMGLGSPSSIGNIINQAWDPNRPYVEVDGPVTPYRLEGGLAKGTSERYLYAETSLVDQLHRDFPKIIKEPLTPEPSLFDMFSSTEEFPITGVQLELELDEVVSVRRISNKPAEDVDLTDRLGIALAVFGDQFFDALRLLARTKEGTPGRDETLLALDNNNALANFRPGEPLFMKSDDRGTQPLCKVRLARAGLVRWLPAYLKKWGPSSAPEMAKALGVSIRIVYAALGELKEQGKVAQEKKGAPFKLAA